MLLDTNAISAWAEQDAGFLAVLRGDRPWYLPSIALGEYRFGVVNSTRREALEQWLAQVEAACVVLAPDAGTARHYAIIRDALRRILIDRARRKLAARHGGGSEHLDVDEIDIAAPAKDDELLAVHEALDRLAAHDAPKAELVKLRYFAGLTIDESAEVLGISAPTAKRWWAFARAWLFAAIRSR